MNFYLGETIKEIKQNPNKENVRIDIRISEVLFKQNLDCEILFKIDPYNDTLISADNINKLINDCERIIKSQLVNENIVSEYSELPNDGIESYKNLKKLCEQALENKTNIICIGD